MPRKPRIDAPGMFHHVMNRGVGGRPTFERPDDFRYFEMLLSCAVRAQRIRIHAHCLMSNHFHLLAESVHGHLGATMRRVQGHYADRFNRTRDCRRPGHLFGGRYKSFAVQDEVYLFTTAGYIDLNPVKAGLCRTPADYPYGSARRFLAARRPPLWLCSDTLDQSLAVPRAQGLTRIQAHAALHGQHHPYVPM